MPNCVSPELVISPVSVKDVGFYICRVNCGDTVEFSQWAQVDVLNVAMVNGKKLESPMLLFINAFLHYMFLSASATGQDMFPYLE